MSISEIYHRFLECCSLSTDSRKINQDCMYVALKGENFDGNKFALDSLNKGAKYAVVDDNTVAVDDRFIVVKDGLKALQDLALYHRNQFNIPIIGITGSNGKTTTKELMHSVLREKYNVLATVGNYNNHIGVPLTLFKLTENHEIAIVEMGASKQGDIKELCDIANPNYGIITNIGKAHLETMGGLEGVLKTKTELFDHIRTNGGQLMVHSCDKLLMQNAGNEDAFYYGALETDNVQGRVVREGDLISIQWKRKETEGSLNDAPIVKTNLTGTYNLPNIMAAVATGVMFDLTDEQIAQGLSSYVPSNNRSEIRKSNGNTYILDAYNANPSSMEVAITNLVSSGSKQQSVILGEMLELGDTSYQEHHSLCARLQTLNLKTVCLVGKEFLTCKDDFAFNFFENVDKLNEWLTAHQPFENETVLIKGSRGNKLEKAADLLLNRG